MSLNTSNYNIVFYTMKTSIISNNFNFKFRLKNGKIISNASNIKLLRDRIKTIPKSSLLFHASNNHLSNWLAARGEFSLASKFRSIKNEDFKNTEERRLYHIQLLNKSINGRDNPIIVEYSSYTEQIHSFIRVGTGSLGGKARGLAFANSILVDYKFKNRFPDIDIRIPNIQPENTSNG